MKFLPDKNFRQGQLPLVETLFTDVVKVAIFSMQSFTQDKT